jgi:hypothetical protein
MAPVLVGVSKCALCGRVLAADDDVRGLPHFITDRDPFYRFSDAAVHEACYREWREQRCFEKKYKTFERERKAAGGTAGG